MAREFTYMIFSDIVEFHGHTCPGLAIGYRMACSAMKALEASRSDDDELLAIVENDACGVDALQYISGCTFGKGNLLFHDYGKQVYTLYSRSTGRGVRVVFHRNELPPELNSDKPSLIEYILHSPDEKMLSIAPVSVQKIELARTRDSINCSLCNEAVMETRLREINGMPTCIPCTERQACSQ